MRKILTEVKFIRLLLRRIERQPVNHLSVLFNTKRYQIKERSRESVSRTLKTSTFQVATARNNEYVYTVTFRNQINDPVYFRISQLLRIRSFYEGIRYCNVYVALRVGSAAVPLKHSHHYILSVVFSLGKTLLLILGNSAIC